MPEHESVDVPEPLTIVGATVHVRPVEGETVAVRLTAPLKLSRDVTVIAEVAAVPAFIVIEVGLVAMVKSWTL